MSRTPDCPEDDNPMVLRGSRFEWEGDWEILTERHECQFTGCQTSAETIFRTFIPQDVADRRRIE